MLYEYIVYLYAMLHKYSAFRYAAGADPKGGIRVEKCIILFSGFPIKRLYIEGQTLPQMP